MLACPQEGPCEEKVKRKIGLTTDVSYLKERGRSCLLVLLSLFMWSQDHSCELLLLINQNHQ